MAAPPDSSADSPAISVVMAVYNGASLVEETLASLQTQTFTDFEIVVADDKSTDDTLGVLARWPDPRLRVLALEENVGPVRARNQAVAAARGQYIAALDHDDICLPERLARQVAVLEADPSLAAVGTATAVLRDGVVSASRYPVTTTRRLIEWLMRLDNPLVWSSMMIRGDAARALEPFSRQERLYAEDFDLYHRLGRLGGIARVDEQLLLYRVHAGSVSKQHYDAMLAGTRAVLAEAYAPDLGPDADALAALVVGHWITDTPCPDRATFSALGHGVARLQQAFLASHDCTPQDIALIRWHTARRWALVGRIGLRQGTLSLADIMAVRPAHLGTGYAGLEDLVLSRIVGGARAARRRLR